MDVVYPYKRTAGDFELRYSLRSLANMPHGKVIISGDAPRFAVSDGVIIHRVPRIWDRYQSSTQNIYQAAKQHVSTSEVIVMNDDFFMTRPWVFKHEHRGTIDEHLASGKAKGEYRRHIEFTRDILRAHGVFDPLFFGLHMPTVYARDNLIRLIDDFRGKRYLLRTIYHNLFPQPATRRDDVKERAWQGEPSGDVLSISDGVARHPDFLKWIEARFPCPSPYEAKSAALA